MKKVILLWDKLVKNIRNNLVKSCVFVLSVFLGIACYYIFRVPNPDFDCHNVYGMFSNIGRRIEFGDDVNYFKGKIIRITGFVVYVNEKKDDYNIVLEDRPVSDSRRSMLVRGKFKNISDVKDIRDIPSKVKVVTIQGEFETVSSLSYKYGKEEILACDLKNVVIVSMSH